MTDMEIDQQQQQQPSSTAIMDIHDPSFVSTLSEPLRGYALQAFSSSPPTNNEEGETEACSSSKENDDVTATSKLDQLEIATRSHLLELVEQLLSCDDDDTTTSSSSSTIIETLLQYLKSVTLLCLHVATHHPSTTTTTSTTSNNNQSSSSSLYSHIPSIAILKKLPYLLVEDTIDSLPLLHIQSLWSYNRNNRNHNHHSNNPPHPFKPNNNNNLCISAYFTTNLLCSPLIFVPASKFVLLRICNKLLKVLSNRDVDAEFAGSLMMITSKVFPLSERSAVNVLGSFNVKNETMYEDEKEFGSKNNLNTGRGSRNQRGDTMEGVGVGDAGSSSKHIGYEFYKTFWGVQKVFTNPQGTILSSRGGGLSQAQAANAYGGFVKDVTSILVALESTPVSKSSSSSMSHLDDNDDNNATATTKTTTANNTVRHHKYLTSSQLLHLQLKDANLRVQFLTQLIIILSYLTSPTVALPTPPIAPVPGADVAKLASQIKSSQMKQLANVLKRTQQLLRSTTTTAGSGGGDGGGGGGESMLRSLQWLLREREMLWRSWKKGKCLPAMDRAGGGNGTVTKSAIRRKLSGRKRKATADDNDDDGSRGKHKVGSDMMLPELATLPKTSVPNLVPFLDPYVEALDPENGIEGEYHPRNDKVYSWRAVRLMARDHQSGVGGEGMLRKFGKLRRRDGDFEGIVREMWIEDGGLEEIGGEMPVDYYDEIAVEEEAGNGANSGKGGEGAEMMDDDAASVGTPEEDAEAKKEQMAQFEKAAMEVEEEMLNEDAAVGAAEGDAADVEGTKKEGGNEGTTKKEADTKENGPIRDAAAETIDSTTNEESKKKPVNDRKEPAVKKEEPKPSSKIETAAKKNVPSKGVEKVQQQQTAETKNGGKKDENPPSAPKWEASNNKREASNTRTTAVVADASSSSNGKKIELQQQPPPRSSSPPRAKFTPPPPKNQQQQIQTKNESRDNNSRGRYVGGRKRNGDERNSNIDHHQQQQQSTYRDSSADGHRGSSRSNRAPPPSKSTQNQRDARPSSSYHHAGGSKINENGRDSGKRDGKSRSPPNNATGGGSNIPSSGKGNVGKGNDGGGGGSDRRGDRGGNSNVDSHFSGGGAGRGRFEPPSGGGGSRRGGGRGGGNRRGRRRHN